MKKNTIHLVFALLGSAAAVAVGCSSSPSTPTGGSNGTGGIKATGGVSGTGGGTSTGATAGGTGGATGDTGALLAPTETGYVVNDGLGVVGAWYVYGDSVGDNGKPPGKCQTVGKLTDAQCSTVTKPDISKTDTLGFPPADVASGKMCTTGSGAKVIPSTADTTADYSNIFGMGIGLDFNNTGTGDGGTGKKPWDATAHNVVGFSFDIDNVPTKGFRVEFALVPNGGDNPYWGGAASNTSPVKAGNNVVMFADVGGPMYVKSTSRIAPDWKQLLSIQFHVSTNTGAAVPFDYCISNLQAIVQ